MGDDATTTSAAICHSGCSVVLQGMVDRISGTASNGARSLIPSELDGVRRGDRSNVQKSSLVQLPALTTTIQMLGSCQQPSEGSEDVYSKGIDEAKPQKRRICNLRHHDSGASSIFTSGSIIYTIFHLPSFRLSRSVVCIPSSLQNVTRPASEILLQSKAQYPISLTQ